MSERSSYSPGIPCWVDVSTPDLDGAIRFYAELFGWDIEKGSEEYGYYSLAHKNGKTVAAIMPVQPGSPAPPMWNTYLASDDVDGAAKLIRDAGGTIVMEPLDVGAEGRMLYAIDPTGAGFGLWQAGRHIGAQLRGADWGDVPSNWSVVFQVEECDAAAAKTRELGGTVLREPQDLEGVGRFAVVADPWGAVFQVIE